MARMREPFTGGVFDVPASKVEKYLGRGYVPLDGSVKPASVNEHPDDARREHERALEKMWESAAPTTDEPKPTSESTIAEIRAWAKANGVALPKKGNKAQLLAAIEEAS